MGSATPVEQHFHRLVGGRTSVWVHLRAEKLSPLVRIAKKKASPWGRSLRTALPENCLAYTVETSKSWKLPIVSFGDRLPSVKKKKTERLGDRPVWNGLAKSSGS